MIEAPQVVNGLLSGIALMVVALVPGLFQGMVDLVRRAESLIGLRAGMPSIAGGTVTQPKWLAAMGAGLVVFSVCAFGG